MCIVVSCIVCIVVVALCVLLLVDRVYCCWLTVCIVVVVLCVLLSYVYLLYYVDIAVFYFICRTAGYK